MKSLAPVLVVVALASSLLAGCGGAPTGLRASIKSASATGSVKAKDYYSTNNAHQIANSALGQYNGLRNQWLRTSDNAQKDHIEDQMLVVLSGAIGQVENAVSAEAGASGYDATEIYNLADNASNQYESLRQQWAATQDINQQRIISNQMQTILVHALEQIRSVQPY